MKIQDIEEIISDLHRRARVVSIKFFRDGTINIEGIEGNINDIRFSVSDVKLATALKKASESTKATK